MLFCLTANYTPKALDAMRQNPNVDRKAAFETLVGAAGGKVVGFYYTTAEGPGAIGIFDCDPIGAAAITGTIASSDAVKDVKMTRLWSNEDVVAIRRKRAEIYSAYKAPGG